MARKIIPAPNVVQFRRPRLRNPGLADALVAVSTARAALAPLDQANAITRFEDDQVRKLIGRAVCQLGEALTDIAEGGSSHENA